MNLNTILKGFDNAHSQARALLHLHHTKSNIPHLYKIFIVDTFEDSTDYTLAAEVAYEFEMYNRALHLYSEDYRKNKSDKSLLSAFNLINENKISKNEKIFKEIKKEMILYYYNYDQFMKAAKLSDELEEHKNSLSLRILSLDLENAQTYAKEHNLIKEYKTYSKYLLTTLTSPESKLKVLIDLEEFDEANKLIHETLQECENDNNYATALLFLKKTNLSTEPIFAPIIQKYSTKIIEKYERAKNFKSAITFMKFEKIDNPHKLKELKLKLIKNYELQGEYDSALKLAYELNLEDKIRIFEMLTKKPNDGVSISNI